MELNKNSLQLKFICEIKHDNNCVVILKNNIITSI